MPGTSEQGRRNQERESIALGAGRYRFRGIIRHYVPVTPRAFFGLARSGKSGLYDHLGIS